MFIVENDDTHSIHSTLDDLIQSLHVNKRAIIFSNTTKLAFDISFN